MNRIPADTTSLSRPAKSFRCLAPKYMKTDPPLKFAWRGSSWEKVPDRSFPKTLYVIVKLRLFIAGTHQVWSSILVTGRPLSQRVMGGQMPVAARTRSWRNRTLHSAPATTSPFGNRATPARSRAILFLLSLRRDATAAATSIDDR